MKDLTLHRDQAPPAETDSPEPGGSLRFARQDLKDKTTGQDGFPVAFPPSLCHHSAELKGLA